MNVLDLRQVLLGHMDEFRGAHVAGGSLDALVQRRRRTFLVVVLLEVEGNTQRKQ